jgi:hypothetical protein
MRCWFISISNRIFKIQNHRIGATRASLYQ